ncbi:hypothetical protein OIS37_15700 [Lactiplantibacillus plantarum]|uniref:hypothetical protein n=1 Tax=Lactiplantibacillus plantarum TaxID=1590 RepID=UPI0021F7DE0D|nr:hypothetical protein [Lactiplantibacillus plantarum]MCW0154575.1 hypothetical protein [Lactiplantibacillus plantarum]
MKLTIVQHVPFEIPGLISEWAAKNHYQIDLVQLFNNDQHLPDPSDVAFLIVLGGPIRDLVTNRLSVFSSIWNQRRPR